MIDIVIKYEQLTYARGIFHSSVPISAFAASSRVLPFPFSGACTFRTERKIRIRNAFPDNNLVVR